MGKITLEFDTKFDIGDNVFFKKNGEWEEGIIEHYSVDCGAGCSIWYEIRTKDKVYSYGHGGDIAEWDIISYEDWILANRNMVE